MVAICTHGSKAGVAAEIGGSPSWGVFGAPVIVTGMIRCSGTQTDSKPASSASVAIVAHRRGPAIIVMPNFIVILLPLAVWRCHAGGTYDPGPAGGLGGLTTWHRARS